MPARIPRSALGGRSKRPLARLAAVFLAAGVLAPTTVAAAPYETFIDVDDEEDLQDLNAAGDITGCEGRKG